MIRWRRNVRWKPLLLLIGSFLLIVWYCFPWRRNSCLIEEYRSKLFCFVLIDEENLAKKGDVIHQTWGHRCGQFTFIHRLNPTGNASFDLPISSFAELPEENYGHLAAKVRQTLLHLWRFAPNYRWYFKGDHDTYLIVENLLRFLIADEETTTIRSLLFGYRFKEGNYVSGGAGYLLTRRALELFQRYFTDEQLYVHCNSSMEDQMVGQCLQLALDWSPAQEKVNLRLIGETVDAEGRERFHPLPFRIHFNGPANKTKREWIHFRPFHHNLFGPESLSDTTISFHYTDPEDMFQMDSFIYQIKRFDRQLCRRPSPFDQ